VPVPARVPSLAEVEAIGLDADPVIRNLRITQAYHELSAGLARRLGAAANWCTFATWASRQAGRTIRGEDLARLIEAELGSAEEVGAALVRLGQALRAVGRVADRSALAATVRDVLSPVRAAERAGQAVAHGNLKVFDEIGREFARLLAAPGEGVDAFDKVAAGLRPGPPPHGQDLLRAAFAAYAGALVSADGRQRAERILLANLRIGLHEQTRLQPEIASALDAPVAHPREVKERLLARLFPGRARLLGRLGLLDDVVDRLVEAVRRRVRAVLTGHLMTLELPDGRLRLGRDVAGVCPPHLLEPADAELRELLRAIDPVAGSPLGSGARDWAELDERMHFIAELFRVRQEDVRLFDAPFDTAQAAAMREGRRPAGRL
jgi:hypothetical protein